MNYKIPYLQQGYLMDTPTTRRWSKGERIRANNDEKKCLFINQTAYDLGKSRIFVLRCDTAEEAASKMKKYNKAIDELYKETNMTKKTQLALYIGITLFLAVILVWLYQIKELVL